MAATDSSVISLVPIDRDGVPRGFAGELPPVANEVFRATVESYESAGFDEPWIGYLGVSGSRAVGTCGFKSPPRDGRVEIAYFTFSEHEGRGVATAMATELVALATGHDPAVLVAAQTLPVRNASHRVLEKLGFGHVATLDHPEDGTVWEWRLGATTELETARLVLRRMTLDDAEFVLRLLNEPSFLKQIGDKGVRTLDDARGYIEKAPLDSYRRHGFGLYMTERKENRVAIGMCGLVKRNELDDPEVGFAFLPEFWGNGYASESASAALAHGRGTLGLDRIVAITHPDNEGSIRVLEKIGLKFERMIRLTDDGPEIKLFG